MGQNNQTTNTGADLGKKYLCKLCSCERDVLDFHMEDTEMWCEICHMNLDRILDGMAHFRLTSGADVILELLGDLCDKTTP
jgi:hypothetical protein